MNDVRDRTSTTVIRSLARYLWTTGLSGAPDAPDMQRL